MSSSPPTAPPGWPKLRNADALQTLLISMLACLASAGVLYLWYLARCLRVAQRSTTGAGSGDTVLLFGKRLAASGPDADYLQRIARVHALLLSGGATRVLLLGGRSAVDATLSEAESGLHALRGLGIPATVDMVLEDASVDTLQNLRNARRLLAGRDLAELPLVLVSSRYHLARCLMLARNLGLAARACAAEDRLQITPALLGRILLEAGYLMWIDVGTGWARLLRSKRMLDQVT